MESIHSTNSNDYYYCANKECVCHEVKRSTEWSEIHTDSDDNPNATRVALEKKSILDFG